MRILALNGSPNKKGNCSFLLDYIGKIVEKNNVEFEIIDVGSTINKAKYAFCIDCSSPCNKSCYKGTELENCLNKMMEADGLIFASPVYFGSASGQIKCLFDKTRAVRGCGGLIGKPGFAVGVGASRFGGQELTVRAIHDMMLVHGMTIVGDGHTDSGAGHKGVCAQKPAENDQYALQRAKAAADRLCQTIKGTT